VDKNPLKRWRRHSRINLWQRQANAAALSNGKSRTALQHVCSRKRLRLLISKAGHCSVITKIAVLVLFDKSDCMGKSPARKSWSKTKCKALFSLG